MSSWRVELSDSPSAFEDILYEDVEVIGPGEEEDDVLHVEGEVMEWGEAEDDGEVGILEEDMVDAETDVESDFDVESMPVLCDANILEPSVPPRPSVSPRRDIEGKKASTDNMPGPTEPRAPEVRIIVDAGVDEVNDVAEAGVDRLPDAHHFEGRLPGNGQAPARGRGRGRRGQGHGRGGGRAGRRGSRGSRGGRGGHREGAAASLEAHAWTRGDPLVEVCVTDDDVPPELKAMVLEVVSNRAARARDQHQRLVARRARELRERQVEREREREERERDEGEVFFDAEEGEEDDLLENETFEWLPMDSYRAQPESFIPEKTGSSNNYNTPYEAFRSFWDNDILNHIVLETNRYASTIASQSFQLEWYPTNIHEILVLFAFWMMLGIIRMPTIKSCFSTDPLLKTSIFSIMFTARRYNNLTRALHFADNANRPQNASRTFIFGPLLDHLNEKFQKNYTPTQNLAIDESLTLWKGKLSFRQYIKSKAARCGVKTFELCESATGYLWSFFIYTGKGSTDAEAEDPSALKSTSVVQKLIRPLLNKGYRLYMDSWFNSPPLARFLKRNGTDCVGTLRPSQREVPPLVSLAKLRQGQYIARHAGDVCVMAWHDKKKIHTISTCHGAEIGLTPAKPHQPAQWKPRVILDYNLHMGAVDRKDQMLEPYLLERKRCIKWYMKLFKRFLNCSILNARILLESSSGAKKDHLSFRLRLVDSILEHHLALCPQSRTAPSRRSNQLPPSRRLPQAHWPVRVEQTASSAARNCSMRVRCHLCTTEGRKNSKTAFKCETCNVPLCIEECFKRFHN